MSDYDDYLKEEDRFFRGLEALPEIRDADEWERRIRDLVARLGVPRSVVLKNRAQCIKSFRLDVPGMSEEDVTATVDELIGLALKSSNRPTTEQEEA